MMINKRLIAMAPEAKSYIVKKIIAQWVSLLAGIVLWFSVGRLLDNVYEGMGMKGAGLIFVIIALCIGARFLLTKAAAYCTHKAAACVKVIIRESIYEKLRRLGPGYSDFFPTAEVVQLAGDGVEQLESYFGNYLPQFIYAILAPVTLFFVFLPLSPLTAIALFVCVPLIPMAIAAVQKTAKRLLGKYWDAYANLGDSFLENLQGLTTLKVYGADGARHKAMNEESERFRIVTMKVLTMQLNSVTIMDFVAYGGTALGSILTARAFLAGNYSVGTAVAMLLLASEFFLAMRALGSYFHVAMNGMAASDRMFRLFDIPEREDGKLEARDGNIEVKNLTFSYTGEKNALSNVSFDIKHGSFVSVCGESGCGKSTLAALISGVRCGYEGSLKMGGTEISQASSASIRKLVTVVSSGSYLFGGDVRSTLLEGKHDASDSEMEDALRRVELYDFVKSQGGLSMKLSDRGANISGGQRQRLALARALLKNSPIYIFDEATSNIDAESEESIMSVIRSLKGSHTILLISHRLSNVVDSDEIIFLKNSLLTERGTHEELMGLKGGYTAVFTAQKELENLNSKEAV